jgi:hypothetical protein
MIYTVIEGAGRTERDACCGGGASTTTDQGSANPADNRADPRAYEGSDRSADGGTNGCADEPSGHCAYAGADQSVVTITRWGPDVRNGTQGGRLFWCRPCLHLVEIYWYPTEIMP